MATKSKTKTIARSSKTGNFVSKAYAKTHKSTTEIERRPKPKKWRRIPSSTIEGGGLL